MPAKTAPTNAQNIVSQASEQRQQVRNELKRFLLKDDRTALEAIVGQLDTAFDRDVADHKKRVDAVASEIQKELDEMRLNTAAELQLVSGDSEAVSQILESPELMERAEELRESWHAELNQLTQDTLQELVRIEGFAANATAHVAGETRKQAFKILREYEGNRQSPEFKQEMEAALSKGNEDYTRTVKTHLGALNDVLQRMKASETRLHNDYKAKLNALAEPPAEKAPEQKAPETSLGFKPGARIGGKVQNVTFTRELSETDSVSINYKIIEKQGDTFFKPTHITYSTHTTHHGEYKVMADVDTSTGAISKVRAYVQGNEISANIRNDAVSVMNIRDSSGKQSPLNDPSWKSFIEDSIVKMNHVWVDSTREVTRPEQKQEILEKIRPKPSKPQIVASRKASYKEVSLTGIEHEASKGLVLQGLTEQVNTNANAKQYAGTSTESAVFIFTDGCSQQINDFMKMHEGNKDEAMGELIGERFNSDGKSVYLVRDFLTPSLSTYAPKSEVYTNFTDSERGEMMGQKDRIAKEKGYDPVTIGWVHTHPGHTVFFSDTDINNHQTRYPGKCGMVIDPQNKTFGLLSAKENNWNQIPKENIYSGLSDAEALALLKSSEQPLGKEIDFSQPVEV